MALLRARLTVLVGVDHPPWLEEPRASDRVARQFVSEMGGTLATASPDAPVRGEGTIPLAAGSSVDDGPRPAGRGHGQIRRFAVPDLPQRAALEHLRKQAKARKRERGIALSQAQHELAREYGSTAGRSSSTTSRPPAWRAAAAVPWPPTSCSRRAALPPSSTPSTPPCWPSRAVSRCGCPRRRRRRSATRAPATTAGSSASSRCSGAPTSCARCSTPAWASTRAVGATSPRSTRPRCTGAPTRSGSIDRGADLADCAFDDEGPTPLDCALWGLAHNRADDGDYVGTVAALVAAGAPTRFSPPTGDATIDELLCSRS
jgi:hypothetical protein